MPDRLILIDGCTRDPRDPDRLIISGRIDGIMQRKVSHRQHDTAALVYAEPELRTVFASIWVSAIDRPAIVHDGHADNGYIYEDSKVHEEHPDQDREICRCPTRTLTPEEQGQALRDALLKRNAHLIGTTIDLAEEVTPV